MDDVVHLIGVLVEAGLVSEDVSHLRLTRRGRKVFTQDHRNGGRLLATSLIESGQFARQARVLLEEGVPQSDGGLHCGLKSIRLAPQLGGLLARWPDVKQSDGWHIPPDAAALLGSVWSLLPEVPELSDDGRKPIGNRGELYSYQFERERTDPPGDIHWVAMDDESLGYDLEDVSASPSRRIEVKASAGRGVRFFMSANEWRKAHQQSERYQVHFWGDIRLGTPLAREYERLRGLGYPLIFEDIPSHVSMNALRATPSQFDVTARVGAG